MRRETLGLGEISRTVDVEERIDRRVRPFGRCEKIARDPVIDLAALFDDQRAAKIVAQGDAPKSDHRMPAPARGGDRELRVRLSLA